MVDFVKTHKTESIIIGICIMMLLFILIFTKIFFFSEKSDDYGTRLEGIDAVTISKDKLDKLAIDLKKEESITNVETNLAGKIINILVTVKGDAPIETMKNKASESLENFSKKEIEFYDIQVFLMSEEVSTVYPTIGYKGKSSTTLLWIQG